MIRRKAIRKIFVTTVSLFIILVVYTITNLHNDNTLKVNLELSDVTGLTNHSVYLLNDDGYLVRKKIYVETENMLDGVKKVVNYLKISNNSKYSSSLVGLIPSNCSLLDVLYDEEFVTLNFSGNFYNIPNMDLAVTAIVYSVFDLGNIKGVTILVDDEYLEGYPKIMDKSLDINRETFITSRDEISKVVVYYLLKDSEETYYVPVTKYLNDSREKINIIVDEMTSSSSTDLVSLVNSNVELLSAREDNDTFILNFNNYLFDNDDEVLEEVLYCLSYSVFDNYDVDMVMVEINGKNISQIERNAI